MEDPFASFASPTEDPVIEHPVAQEPASVLSTVSKSRSLFVYDFETVPDSARYPMPALELIPERIIRPHRDDIDLADFVQGSVSDIKKEVENPNGGFSDEQLNEILELENAKLKPRKGVRDAVELAMGDKDAMEAGSRNEDAISKWRKEGSVNPLKARIVAFGWSFADGNVQSLTACSDAEERIILEQFWKLIKTTRRRCGYNILHFDDLLAVIRSLVLGVEIPRALDRRKYGNREAIDLMVALFPSGSPMKCKDVAGLLGIAPPAGDMEGSQVFDLYSAGDMKSIAEYVRSDVQVELEMYLLLADALVM